MDLSKVNVARYNGNTDIADLKGYHGLYLILLSYPRLSKQSAKSAF